MIINKLIIENYLCYYGIKEFELSNGLNIILGDNGEGKTKFFEAVDWLFTGENRGLDLLVSAKAIAETPNGDSFKVRVTLHAEQYDEKIIVTKSFLVKKLLDDDISVSNYMLEGIEENKLGERSPVDGKTLLDRIFPTEIRRYSLFKGEAELNIFENQDALSNLINLFSHAKYYEIYSEKGKFLREKAEKAVDDSTRCDTKNKQEYKRLEGEIINLINQKSNLVPIKNLTEEQINKTEGFITEAEKYVNHAEALETINNRIKGIEDKISKTSSAINESYTTLLFDEKWILVNFESIHSDFVDKINALSSKKRELQSEFDKNIGVIEGKKQLTAEILNNSIPLPTGVPSKAHMEEMLKDEWCKVCNRSAKKGTAAYKFMLSRLEEYIKSQEPETFNEIENQTLFIHDYMNRLVNLTVTHEDSLASLRSVRKEIKALFKFNGDRRDEITELNGKLEKEIEERKKIIGASSLGADKLSDVLKNYNKWQEDLTKHRKDLLRTTNQIEELEKEIKDKKAEKDNIDTKTANTFLIKTRAILRDIETIFNETKERKTDEFIQLLQEKSNKIFGEINIEDFTGTIFFKKKIIADQTKVSIELQEDGKTFHKPNQSLLTSMHMSVLFAISELAAELREDSYPMIFDAPTSSFGETKTGDFLNLIYETKKQRIILFYDFIGKDDSGNPFIKPEFNNVRRMKAFWIKRQRPFDKNKLKTINTEIITL